MTHLDHTDSVLPAHTVIGFKPEPGESIVVTLAESHDFNVITAFGAAIKERFPDHQVLVLEPGVELATATEAQARALAADGLRERLRTELAALRAYERAHPAERGIGYACRRIERVLEVEG